MSTYTEKGYEDREEYLESLAEDMCVDYEYVHELAALLGEDEDFDGLVTAVEDYAEGLGEFDY